MEEAITRAQSGKGSGFSEGGTRPGYAKEATVADESAARFTCKKWSQVIGGNDDSEEILCS